MQKLNLITTRIYYINLILLLLKIYYSVSDIIILPNIISKAITFWVIASYMFILLIKTISHRFSKKQCIGYYLILILCFISSIITKDYNIILSYLVVICIKDIDLKKVLKIIIIVNVTMILLHIFLYICNLIFKLKNVRVYYNNESNIRHNFLLGHPNYFSSIVFWTYASYVYIKYDKIQIIDYILGFVLAIFIQILPKSRTTVIAFAIFILLIFISKLNKNITNLLLKIVAKYIFIVCSITIITCIVTYKYMNTESYSTIKKMDTLLSGRIWYSQLAYEKYGCTIIGQFIDYVKPEKHNKPIILDNFYAKSFVNYGVCYLILLSYLFFIKNKRMRKEEYVYVIIFCVIGICETHILNACIGITLLILGDIIQNRNEDYEKMEIKGE